MLQNTIVKDGKKVLAKELIEQPNKELPILEKNILANFFESKAILLDIVESNKTSELLKKSIKSLIDSAENYIQIVRLIKNTKKKGGRKKSEVQYNLAVDVVIEFISSGRKGALPVILRFPTGKYLYQNTNEKIEAYNLQNKTKHPKISPRTADNWLEEMKKK
jgi:hypothetical protein